MRLTFVYLYWLELAPHRVQRDEDQNDPNILDYGQQLKNWIRFVGISGESSLC